MPAWTADALILIGGAISTVELAWMLRHLVRLRRARRAAPPDPKAAAVARLEAAISASSHAIVEGFGVTLMFAGLAMSARVPPVAMLSGVLLVMASASSALTLRWVRRRLG